MATQTLLYPIPTSFPTAYGVVIKYCDGALISDGEVSSAGFGRVLSIRHIETNTSYRVATQGLIYNGGFAAEYTQLGFGQLNIVYNLSSYGTTFKTTGTIRNNY